MQNNQNTLTKKLALKRVEVLTIVKEWYNSELCKETYYNKAGIELPEVLDTLLQKYSTVDEPTEEHKRCPYCDASMKKHWHRLSKGLVNTLIKFKKKVIELQQNKVHIKDQCNYSKVEFANFQKLRYFGLVAKWVNSDNEHEGGYWLLTKRGNQFLKSEIAIPLRVLTFRNKIHKRSEELYKISDVLAVSDLPYWDDINTIEYEYADISDIEDYIFDSNGQGLLF